VSLSAVHHALREPESFAVAWAADPPAEPGLLGLGARDLPVFVGLLATASAGVGAYAAALHAHAGLGSMLLHGGSAVAAAGVAWSATLPSLYVMGSLLGSRLATRSLLLAAMVTVSFGGIAMLASLPVLWFFELCLPYGWTRLLVALITFAGVGVSMKDVFSRVMAALEGPRIVHHLWLFLLTVVGAELFFVVGVFDLI